MEFALSAGAVGDFISIAVLIKDIIAALDDSRGSAKEYQELVQQLNVLSQTLDAVQQTFNNPHLTHSLECISGIALDTVAKTKNCLNDFLHQISKYEPTLGASTSVKKASLVSVRRKIQWKLNEKDVDRFRTEVVGYNATLQVVIGVITVLATQLKVSTFQITSMMHSIVGDLSSIKSIVMRLDRGPSDEHFILEDIIGRVFPIHLKTITSWEVLDFILRERFKGKKGAGRVQHKRYTLRENKTHREIDGSIPWDSAFLPYQKVNMSLICNEAEGNDASGKAASRCPFCKTPSDSVASIGVEVDWKVYLHSCFMRQF
ncbi:vegetative cell wall [Fusarium sporotrichioides]|uniref:Vegetative cell wall n=1 Tax=Fusarium sporotrichioides TaxID=5514 RepID=A0A395SC28_FUSSP|nr:vegetative cell wall [Fusarium sporotrichioides]